MAPPSLLVASYHQLIFNNALQAYERRTKTNLLAHPLAAQLQSRDTPATIITLLREQLQIQTQETVDKLTKWLDPIVNVLHTLSVFLGEDIRLIISPAKVIFIGVGILLSAATESPASLDLLINIFERIEKVFLRLEANLGASLTREMVDIVVRIMVDILSILAIATMEVKQGSRKKFMKRLFGKDDIENGLKRLDTEEARMASAQLMQATQPAGNRVRVIMDKELDAWDNVVSVDSRERGVGSREATINDKFAWVNIDGGEARVAVQQIASDEPQRKLTELHDLIDWLSPPDPSTNHDIARRAHHEGTAKWFLEDSTFKRWKSTMSTDSLLWVHGKPGSGKSVLCSAIIEDIEFMCKAGLASMAYFYFDFRDINKQCCGDMISSVLPQLSAQSIRCRDMLHRLYLAHFSGKQVPSDGLLTECLKDMLLIPNEGPVYIFMDAIDECPNSSGMPSPREQILGLVEELVDLRLPNLRLFVTSRPETDIRAVLEPLSSFQVPLHDKTGQQEDITNYIRGSVRSMRGWREEDKELVIKVITERADGGFRWVFCQLEMLRRCFPPRVRYALDESPQTLDGTYERILMQIKLANRNPARRLFQCLAVAIRPLRVEELAEVPAIDFDTKGAPPKLKVNWRWEDPEQGVLSACSSLVTIVDAAGSRVVKFSHFSVKEFLTSSRLAASSGRVSFYHISLEPAHTILAQACLSVLLLLDDHFDRDNIKQFPLAEYAAKHWADHARFKNVTSRIQEGIELLFDPENPHFANWVSIYDMDESLGSPTSPHPTRPNATPLYYAALCGLPSLVEWLIVKHHMDVNSRGGHYVTAIRAALYRGHLSVVRLLLDYGADINFRDVEGSSLLHVAAQTGDPEAVSLLLSRGADVQATDSSHWPVLFTALSNGSVAIVRRLIECGADVGVRDGDRSTALHIASGNEDLDVVRFLLDCGAEVDPHDNHGCTPLHLASTKGNGTISRLLVECGAHVNALDNMNSTPLHLASTHGDPNFAFLLIELGAYVGARDSENSTPLHLASAKGNDTIAKLLMERGAHVGALDNTNSTPLHLAAMHGSYDVVFLLILHGASVDACDSKNSTPLHLASTKGNHTVIRLLLDHGANVVSPGEKGNTPLHLASRHGHFDVVKLLLERGAQPNVQNDKGRTPLHIASQEGAVDVVQYLLTGGASVNVRDHDDKTPQDVALNNSGIVQLPTGHARPNKQRDSRNGILSRLQTVVTRKLSP